MKRNNAIFVFVAIIAIVFFVVFFITDFFQELGLRIPKNYQQCVKFGGTVKAVPDRLHAPLGEGEPCVWKGIKFKEPYF